MISLLCTISIDNNKTQEMCKTCARQVQKETEQHHLSMLSLVFRLSSKPFSLRLTIASLKMI